MLFGAIGESLLRIRLQEVGSFFTQEELNKVEREEKTDKKGDGENDGAQEDGDDADECDEEEGRKDGCSLGLT